jgi:sugar phosphate isomerase/epimerase
MFGQAATNVAGAAQMMNRREAVKAGVVGAFGLMVGGGAMARVPSLMGDGRDATAAKKLGFELGTQAWTFRDRSAFETLEIAKTLGLGYVEFYSGQVLSPKTKDARVGYDLTAAQRADLLGAAKAAGITPRAYGVISPSKDEADTRRHFEFAKEMQIGVITCEPTPDAWDLVDKLAKEYSIKAACHNHPKDSRYWNPDTVLASVKDRSASVGACADIGHWTRSGLDAVECLKKYEGRLISLHLKDVKEVNGQKIDQPWGTGATGMAAVLRELRRQKFAGYMSVEYEHGAGKELEENVKKSIAFFDATCAAIVAEEAKAAKPAKEGTK